MTNLAVRVDPAYAAVRRDRAGFWLRVGASLLDAAIILLPLQLLVVVLFAQTDGKIQGSFGLAFTICADLNSVPDEFPHTLERIDTAQDCQVTLFGLPMSRKLVLTQVDQADGRKTNQTEDLRLNADGFYVEKLWLYADLPALAIFLLYLVAYECRIGQTVGKYALDIKVVDRTAPDSLGIPLRKAILRHALLFAPIFAFLLLQLGVTTLGAAVFVGLISLAFAAVWLISVTISLVGKTDPIYDRLAGTIVVKT